LRKGLQRFPGNDIILNNLLYTLHYQTRADEAITLCKTLIESTKDDSVKYDACRILACCYKENGQIDLIKPTLEIIPEIYFSKLELVANLLDGEESYEAAQKHKNICADDLISMMIIAGKRLKEKGEHEKAATQFRIAEKIIDAFKDDFLETEFFDSTLYECLSENRKEIEQLLQS
jgi:tetratricopeptide (TPR) repeat protein